MVRILVVDDDPGCLDSLRALLVFWGFDVATAVDGPKAVAIGTSYLPDVLIVDWALGRPMNGLEVAEALRAINPKMQIIVISGHPSAESDPALPAFPAVAFLAKPFRSSQLLGSIEQAVKTLQEGEPGD